jgi:hypothetical protein
MDRYKYTILTDFTLLQINKEDSSANDVDK